MAFRACSRLETVEIGPAKTLFHKYRRLGVYEWKDLMTITKGNSYGEIMAIHFCDTELFKEPVSLAFAQNLGAAKMLQSPCPISESAFFDIYRKGMNQ